MTNALRFEDHIGLVRSQAAQAMAWAASAGSGLDFDDLYQIASVAFCIAAKGYKPETGLKFSTYYNQVAFSEMRREIGIMTGVKNLNPEQRAEIAQRKKDNERRRAAALPELPIVRYGLGAISFCDLAMPSDDGAAGFEQALPSAWMTPEQQIELRQLWRHHARNLSPLASLMVEWLRDPPEALVRELQAQRAHAEVRNAMGLRCGTLRDGITIGAINRLLQMIGDVPKRALMQAEGELMRALEQYEEACV